MPTRNSFDYAIVRLVPRVEREEFLNVGVILFARQHRFLKARIELDRERLAAFAPHLDHAEVQKHLDLIPLICEGGAGSGPIGQLPLAERFHWLVAPRSTLIQTSPVHAGICEDPERALERLMNEMVRLRDDQQPSGNEYGY